MGELSSLADGDDYTLSLHTLCLSSATMTGADNTTTSLLPNNTSLGPQSYHVSEAPERRYSYHPLNEERKEFRIIELPSKLESAHSTEISIRLHAKVLTIDDCPEYEALSYVWGSPENPVEINVGDLGETMEVSQNLAEALPYLQHQDTARWLWIDAICINQKDLRELGAQVQRMGSIYKMAQQVVVFLGPEVEGTSLGIDALKTINDNINVNWTEHTCASSDPEAPHWADYNESLPFDENTMQGLFSIWDRPWFERLWTQQELALSSKAIFIIGSFVVDWDELADASFCVWMKPTKQINTSFSRRVELCKKLRTNTTLSFVLDWIYATRDCFCSDERDRIYALLGCMEENLKLEIVADYTISSPEVYRRFVLAYLRKVDDLSVLSFCEKMDDESSDLPSWVPRLNVQLPTNPLRSLNSSGYSYGHWKEINDSILQVEGVKAGVIKSFRDITIHAEDLYTTISELFPQGIHGLDKPYIGRGTLLEAYLLTLCAGRVAEMRYPPDGYLPRTQAMKEIFKEILAGSELSDEQEVVAFDYMSFLQYFCKGRVLYQTVDGRIGIGPKSIASGDIVCVALGCWSPLILRPVQNGCYELVGETYVCGLVWCEALLGPLPEAFDHIMWIQDGVGNAPAYRNRDTGQIETDDPRLGPLPDGWRLEVQEDGGTEFWFNGEESEKTHCDPRLTAEALRSQGVAIESFDLV